MLVCVVLSCLFLVALWSPAGKGLTSWLSCMLCFSTVPNVSWSTSELRARLGHDGEERAGCFALFVFLVSCDG